MGGDGWVKDSEASTVERVQSDNTASETKVKNSFCIVTINVGE